MPKPPLELFDPMRQLSKEKILEMVIFEVWWSVYSQKIAVTYVILGAETKHKESI